MTNVSLRECEVIWSDSAQELQHLERTVESQLIYLVPCSSVAMFCVQAALASTAFSSKRGNGDTMQLRPFVDKCFVEFLEMSHRHGQQVHMARVLRSSHYGCTNALLSTNLPLSSALLRYQATLPAPAHTTLAARSWRHESRHAQHAFDVGQ